MKAEQNTETEQAGALPRSIEEAIDAYSDVLAARRVPIKSRKHYVRWVSEFDGYRVSTLRRSFRTCTNADVAGFLQGRKAHSSLAEWQLKQAHAEQDPRTPGTVEIRAFFEHLALQCAADENLPIEPCTESRLSLREWNVPFAERKATLLR